MKILFIHQYFGTPEVPGPTRAFWNCQEIMKNGHEVVVIRSLRKNEKFVQKENYKGIKIISIRVAYSNKMGVWRRFLSFLIFMLISTYYAFIQTNINLVISSSTPLTVGFPALLLKKIKGIPFVFEVRDLWPEVPIQMGAVKNKTIIAIAKWFEKTIYKSSEQIIALSPGMKDGVIDTGIPPEKITMIPNMSNVNVFRKRPVDQTMTQKFGITRDTFKLIYFGALGKANSIEYIVDTAIKLKNEKEIEFYFIGEGALLPYILNQKATHKLANVHYLGFHTLTETSEIVNACDVSIVTFGDLPILGTNSPTKLFDSLAAGKPIIVNSSAWTKELVEKHECGVYVNPKSTDDFVSKILFLKNSPVLLKKMGENGIRLATTDFDKSVLCEKFYGVIEKCFKKE